MMGTAKEVFGNTTGLQSWSDAGRKQHQDGEAEITAARAQNYVEGTGDRIQGKYDAVAGAVTGDKSQQASGTCPRRTARAAVRVFGWLGFDKVWCRFPGSQPVSFGTKDIEKLESQE